VGWAVKHLGNTSLIYQFGIFANDDEMPRAQGEYIHVQIERATKTTCPIEGERRVFFEKHLINNSVTKE
jgi:acyl-CoA thioester hydrolase